jgi:hypothetical protein
MTAADWDHISSELEELLANPGAGLPHHDRENVAGFIQAGEFGVAFETLCTQMYEYDVALLPSDLVRIAVLGRQLALDPSVWEVLGG